MPFKDLKEFLDFLEEKNELVRIRKEVDPKYEGTAIAKKMDKEGGPAVLFEKIKGYGPEVSVVANVLGTRRRLAFGLETTEKNLVDEYLKRREKLVPPKKVNTGPVKEVVEKGEDIDILRSLPVFTYHEDDASPYISAGVVVSKNPETGLLAAGIHRVQVRGKNKLGALVLTPPVSTAYNKAEEMDKPLDVAIAVGLEPATLFASVVLAPMGPDKFTIAGSIRNEPVELTGCETVDVEVPAYAEVVVEGKLLPKLREVDGPFGETGGYYVTTESPVLQVNAITHRSRFIYQVIVPWTAENMILFGTSWEGELYKTVKTAIPAVKALHLTVGSGCAHAVLMVKKRTDEEARQALAFILSVNPFIKHAVAVDEDVDIYNPKEVEWALATRFQGDKDMVVLNQLPGSVLDPSTGKNWTTTKIGFDATKPLTEVNKYRKVRVPEEIEKKVEENWDTYF